MRRRFLNYALVGSLGFAIDSSVLTVATRYAGCGLYAGRVLSFITSATFTWYLNRIFTYRDRQPTEHDRRADQWARYLSSSLVGAAVNYGVYCLIVAHSAWAARHPVSGVAAGSIAGMAFNFSAYSLWVFRRPSSARMAASS